MKVVISYKEPDLDGVSCMYAYSELLKKQEENADFFVWGTPRYEVKIVCDLFNIELKGISEEQMTEKNQYIATDLNGIDQMHKAVTVKNLIEIIDHHSINKLLPTYNNIERVQIDRVGAAATIVTERYKESGFIPSRESAILLFYGIISNSINLKASITKKRDFDACNWLKSVCSEISDERIKEIFQKKSKIEKSKLRDEMECEVPMILPNFKVIVAQLEIANLEEFLKENKQEIINIMKTVKEEKSTDFVFINCVDILNGYTLIFAADEETKNYIIKAFNYEFDEKDVVKIDKVVQRKELTRVVRQKI